MFPTLECTNSNISRLNCRIFDFAGTVAYFLFKVISGHNSLFSVQTILMHLQLSADYIVSLFMKLDFLGKLGLDRNRCNQENLNFSTIWRGEEPERIHHHKCQ